MKRSSRLLMVDPRALVVALDAARQEARAVWPSASVSVSTYGETDKGSLGWCLRIEANTTSSTLTRVCYVGPVVTQPLQAIAYARRDPVYADVRAAARDLAALERELVPVAADAKASRTASMVLAQLLGTAETNDGRKVEVLAAGIGLLIRIRDAKGNHRLSLQVNGADLARAALELDANWPNAEGVR